MTEAAQSGSTTPPERKRDKAAKLLKQGFSQGELALKHSVGLGNQPNIIPEGDPHTDAEPRQVLVGWHPVGGLAGKWFAEQTGLGKLITEKINSYPDPTQHWAVLVGDYVHQLWMDESFYVIYTNEKIKVDEWHTFAVGTTRFNDDAIRRTGQAIIESIRAHRPEYNLISNNCQTYALLLLDAIKGSGESKFPTTLNVYDRLVGPGKVMELFTPPEGAEEGPEAVAVAQNVMAQNTTHLDTHAVHAGPPPSAERDTSRSRSGSPEKKPGIISRIFRKK